MLIFPEIMGMFEREYPLHKEYKWNRNSLLKETQKQKQGSQVLPEQI